MLVWDAADPPLEALQAGFWVSDIKVICGWVFEAFRPATEGSGNLFRASIIGTVGPSLLIFGHLNIPRFLEACWNLICAVSRRKLGAQQAP